MKRLTSILAVFCALFLVIGTAAIAAERSSQDPREQTGKAGQTEMQKGTEKSSQEAGETLGTGRSTETGKLGEQSKAFPAKAGDIIGMNVKNEQDEDLGKINNLLIGRDGSVAFAIVSYGGILGVGDSLIPVPWREIRPASEENTVIISFTKEQLDKAPKLDVDQLVNEQGADWRSKLSRFYTELKSGKMSDEWGKAAGKAGQAGEQERKSAPGMQSEQERGGTSPSARPETERKY